MMNSRLVIGVALFPLVKAKHKYFCYFEDHLSARCLGKSNMDLIKTISQHGAVDDPDRPNHRQYVNNVCRITRATQRSSGGSLHVPSNGVCDIDGLRGATVEYTMEWGGRLSGKSTSYTLSYPRSTKQYRFDKLKPIAVSKLDLSQSSPGAQTWATFESHRPLYWRAVLTSHPVTRVKATFSYGGRAGLQGSRDRSDVDVLETRDGIMKLQYNRSDGSSANGEAFFFALPSSRQTLYGVMVTFHNEPEMLFDTRLGFPVREGHGHRQTSRYRSQNRERPVQRDTAGELQQRETGWDAAPPSYADLVRDGYIQVPSPGAQRGQENWNRHPPDYVNPVSHGSIRLSQGSGT
ncbi:hypothetical protein FOZ60_002874 [Perkinsus olseni]|uniref:Uncharacterized protein n=1 Tax=Perkinsus olseni TaxID=32597 RepID=A0A7J6NWT2_PEROL|nr:hypothetical protein FOZ60_002874 [Perkinsus olseni]